AAGGVEDPVGAVAPAQLPYRGQGGGIGGFAPVSGDVLAAPVQHGGDVVGGAELALGDGLDEELAGVPAEQLRRAEGAHEAGPGGVGDRAVSDVVVGLVGDDRLVGAAAHDRGQVTEDDPQPDQAA